MLLIVHNQSQYNPIKKLLLKLEFINYPKFPLEIEAFKEEIIKLGSHLLNKMRQNRTVIVFPDETIMLEIDEAIDPRI